MGTYHVAQILKGRGANVSALRMNYQKPGDAELWKFEHAGNQLEALAPAGCGDAGAAEAILAEIANLKT